MTGRLGSLFGVLAAATVAVAQPAAPPTTQAADLDRRAVDVLKDIHNRGAELYNRGDAAGCYRLYDGALAAVRPFLAHRPAVLKVIDDGFAEVAKTPDGAKSQAFRLHEVIEQVRAELKAEARKPDPVSKVTPQPKVDPVPVAPNPKEEPKPTPAPPVVPKPKDEPKPGPAPAPKVEPKADPKPAGAGGAVSGKVTLNGQSLDAADVTLVSLDAAKPQVFTAKVQGGAYTFDKPVPTGKYAVMVTGPKVPEKFQTTASGLRVMVAAAGPNTFDLNLTAK